MREKVIEQKLVQKVRERGGLALKLVCPGFNGVPDRLLLFPGMANRLRLPVADASQEKRLMNRRIVELSLILIAF